MPNASILNIFGTDYLLKDGRLTDFFLKTKKDLYFQNPRFLIFDFSDVNRRSVKIRKGTYIDLLITSGGITTVRTLYADSDVSFDLSAKITAAAAASSVRTGEENGKDFYVYLVPDGADGIDLTVSERKDYPGDIDAGYTSDNTRRIGQFHTLCVDAAIRSRAKFFALNQRFLQATHSFSKSTLSRIRNFSRFITKLFPPLRPARWRTS